jgi:predicted transcriptional regulator
MQEKSFSGELLNMLSFTNNEVAQFAGVSESMVRKVRSGVKKPSRELEKKIVEFVKKKAETVLSKVE